MNLSKESTSENIFSACSSNNEGQKGWNDRFGHGIVDASAAVSRARLELGFGRVAALLALLVLLWSGRRRSLGFKPGFLVAAKALLDVNPRPSRAEIKTALSGNLCRCTGYSKIITAVEQAAQQMQEGGA